MLGIARMWRNWVHGRKFARKGSHCRFIGRTIEIDGHVELGDYCRLRDNIVMRTRRNGKIIVGDRVVISWGVIIEASELVQIGDFAGISEHVIIRDGTHMIYGTKANWKLTPHIIKPVVIGPHTWIGSRSYISYGVTIGEGAVVGVHSVVTRDIPPYEVWAGAPARFLSHRTENVRPEKLREAQELIARQGIREDRRNEELGEY